MSREGGLPTPTAESSSSSSHKTKRQQVLAACENCRHHKIKCDGQPVCRECRRRKIQCVYVTRAHESHGQAVKRRADELFQANHSLERVFNALAGQDEDEAVAIFRSIRAGQQPASILQDILHGRTHRPVEKPYESQLREAFIIALAQSTAPLDQIVELATHTLTPPMHISLPPLASYRPLRDRIVTLNTMHELVAAANPEQRSMQERADRDSVPLRRVPDGAYSGPTFWVPASPWTSLTANDAAVSHLVTIFLTYINPYSRCVEEDLFLNSMRQPTQDSTYCTRFLVHAILACASLYSEIDEAFDIPGNLLTRGDHFHKEAVRLWELEDGRQSITNMQALLVLALGSLPRGKCQLGWSFVKIAAAQNQSLPIPSLESATDETSAKYARARACAANSIVSANVAYALRLLAHTDELEVRIDDAFELEDLLPDTQVWWNGYLLKHQPVPIRQSLLIRYRWQLTCFGWELLHIVFSHQQPTLDQLWDVAEELINRLKHWYASLPAELHYTNSMTPALYEFHGHCLCVFMTLYRQLYAMLYASPESSRNQQSSGRWSSPAVRNELRKEKLEYAMKAAYLSRDFASEYGWKIAPPYIPQQTTSAIFIFLQEMQERAADISHGSAATVDVERAFEDCFRCLLGIGVQQMLSRGIARMIYHTSTMLELKLPRLAEGMLQIVADVAWQPEDWQYLDSIFPNPIIANSPTTAQRELRMSGLLQEWEEGGSEQRE